MNLKLILRTLLFFLSIWMCASSAYAQISLMKDGKTKAKIILAEDSQMNRVAANLFQSFFQKITGKTLPVVIKQIPQKGDILIGEQSSKEVTEDGFSIFTGDGILRISGQDNGVVYGVITLLEQYLGVDYWGKMNILSHHRKQ